MGNSADLSIVQIVRSWQQVAGTASHHAVSKSADTTAQAKPDSEQESPYSRAARRERFLKSQPAELRELADAKAAERAARAAQRGRNRVWFNV